MEGEGVGKKYYFRFGYFTYIQDAFENIEVEMLNRQLYMWTGVQKRAFSRVCICNFKVFRVALRKIGAEKALEEKDID